MTPHRGNTMYSLPFLPATPSSPSWPLKGFLSCHGALKGPSTRLVRGFQNYRDSRTPSCKGARTPSTTTETNLDCPFVENALFTLIRDCERGQQNRIELGTRPANEDEDDNDEEEEDNSEVDDDNEEEEEGNI